MKNQKLIALEKQLYKEVDSLLKNEKMREVIKHGITPLYGPLMENPKIALITWQGGGADKIIQKETPKQMLYLTDANAFGRTLRRYMNLCNLFKIFSTSTVAHALIFPQAPSNEAAKWGTKTKYPLINKWREFSIRWNKKLLLAQSPELIIIFGKKVCEFLEIEWEEPYKHKNFTEFAEGYLKLKNPETNKEVLYKTIYCHHLSQGYTKEGVTKAFKRVKVILDNTLNN